MADFILGVDLGQAQDFTAITVLEVTGHDTGRVKTTHRPISVSYGFGEEIGSKPHYQTINTPILENHYAVRHLERLPMGTPYPKQVEHVGQLYSRLQAMSSYRVDSDGVGWRSSATVSLVVDQTGVGRPVVDMLKAEQLRPIAITITGGDSVTRDGLDYRVPKRDLVSVVQVLLQSERLKIASNLAEAQTLINELLAFKVSINLRGHDSYGNDVGEWRENPHDDLVLAVALAAWWGE